MRKIAALTDSLLGYKNIVFIVFISIFYLVLRFPSLAEPYWYGDEGVYEVIGSAITQGRVLYSEIWDNKPPLLYLIYALFAGDQFYVRLFSLIVGLLTVLMFFALARKLFKNTYAIFISTIFFAFMFGSPIIEGNIANAENFMLLPVLCAFYLCFASVNSPKNFFFAGLLFSFAFLIKIVALFDFIAVVLILLTTNSFQKIALKTKSIKKEWRIILGEKYLVIGFLIPLTLTFLYFIIVGAFPDFLSAVFSHNVGYVEYGNFFIVENGLLYSKIILLIVSVFVVFRFRKTLGVLGVMVFIWAAFELFSALFSARPYTHYLLVLLPSLSLLLGFIIEDKKLRVISLVAFFGILFVLNNNFKVQKKLLRYYTNYVMFMIGVNDINTYRNSFDSDMVLDYELANFIKTKTEEDEKVFLWGDAPQIYALSGKLPPGRYTVAYHITSYPAAIEETKMAIDKTSPKYIIQTKNDPAISNFLEGYALRYEIGKAKIYERQP